MFDERPHVRVEPGYRFGQPHIRGISAENIAGMVVAGESVETVMDEYGLSRAEVLIACWFMGEHGSKKWRQRWRSWASDNYGRLSQHRYDEVEDPPCDAEIAEVADV